MTLIFVRVHRNSILLLLFSFLFSLRLHIDLMLFYSKHGQSRQVQTDIKRSLFCKNKCQTYAIKILMLTLVDTLVAISFYYTATTKHAPKNTQAIHLLGRRHSLTHSICYAKLSPTQLPELDTGVFLGHRQKMKGLLHGQR